MHDAITSHSQKDLYTEAKLASLPSPILNIAKAQYILSQAYLAMLPSDLVSQACRELLLRKENPDLASA